MRLQSADEIRKAADNEIVMIIVVSGGERWLDDDVESVVVGAGQDENRQHRTPGTPREIERTERKAKPTSKKARVRQHAPFVRARHDRTRKINGPQDEPARKVRGLSSVARFDHPSVRPSGDEPSARVDWEDRRRGRPPGQALRIRGIHGDRSEP